MKRSLLVLALLLTACSAPPAPSPKPAPSGVCPQGNPLANVYHPQRLIVQATCVTAKGTVLAVLHEDDGDLHIWLAPGDDATAKLLRPTNVYQGKPALVVEIVPADQPGCIMGQPPRPAEGTKDFGVCTGRAIRTPKRGDMVRVVGTYNLDKEHGLWGELHPVWSVETIG
ncbi:MAG: hypothetical protein KGL39_20825 [Patescibacteria group bacterium]|nr:hypothetical protein [Patescibacteria group bacterium]